MHSHPPLAALALAFGVCEGKWKAGPRLHVLWATEDQHGVGQLGFQAAMIFSRAAVAEGGPPVDQWSQRAVTQTTTIAARAAGEQVR
jgi:hypothetical protein